jgi:hypothetical protein
MADKLKTPRKRRGKLCARYETPNAYDVALYQRGIDNFTVVYGLAEKPDLTWRAAAHELGECLWHALTNAGKIRQRGDG